jgi:hypothetical protein
MKKSIVLHLALMLMFGLSLNLSAQSVEEELDQAELIKQLLGTWEAEIGKDSIIVLTFTSFNNGIELFQENKANGVTYVSYNGIFGFSVDKKMIFASAVAPNGTMINDVGRFVEKDKYVIERYFGNKIHIGSMLEWEFIDDESFVIRAKQRGNGMSWPDDWVEWFTFKKID